MLMAVMIINAEKKDTSDKDLKCLQGTCFSDYKITLLGLKSLLSILIDYIISFMYNV